MRINELLTESQLEQLDEGPISRGIGKFVGGVAKGVGAVAGGVVGAGRALKKGYQTGKAVVGDDPDPNAGQPGYTDPAPSTPPPTAQDINAQGPAGSALAKTTAVVDKQQAQSQEKANQTVYAQVKANVNKLDKKGKQRILQLLQKSVAAPVPKAPPATTAAPEPTTLPADNSNQQQTKKRGGRVKGAGPSMTPSAVRRRETRAAAAKQSKVGNAVMGNMANQLSQQNASKINYGNALSEALAARVEMHKQKIFETGLSKGTISVFRK